MKLSIAVLNALFAAALAAPAPGLAPRSNTRARIEARRGGAKSYRQGQGHHHDGSGASSSLSRSPAAPTGSVLPSGFPSPSAPSGSPSSPSVPSGRPSSGASSVRPSATAAAQQASASSSSSSETSTAHSTADVEYNESWAGAVVTGSDMTGVSASFEVPDPAIPTSGQTSATEHTASTWIGMDGYNCDGGLWQAGVDATIDSQGTSFYAWYEWYPEDTVVVDLGDIAAGDVITVNLTSSSGDYTTGSIVMENQSNGKSFTKTVSDTSAALCGSAIEWIMEDLVVDGSENGLANFGTVTFTDAAGTSSSGSVSITDAQILDIEDSDGTALTASSVTSDTVVIVYQIKKRRRACEECHRLKIKCDLSTSPGGSCERCSGNGLDCVPAASRLQRDRIRDLEAEIQNLKSALSDQSHRAALGQSMPQSRQDAVLSFLDARIPAHKQQDLLLLFKQKVEVAWPIVCMPTDLNEVRAKSPFLLLSVLVYTFTQELQGIGVDMHHELVWETMHTLSAEVMGRGQRSLELVQALLVAAFWNKSSRKGQQASCFQLVQIAIDMAIDLGIGGYALQPSAAAYFSRHEDPTSLEARRTWLSCFFALSTSAMSTRRRIAISWDDHHQACLSHLEGSGGPSDILLCQIVRIQQLIQKISEQQCLSQLTAFVDGNDHRTHVAIDSLKDRVDAWAAQIPPSLVSCQTLRVWQHVAMIHVYEVVLHTPTNKAMFAAPFIPGRIAIRDFPKPADIIPPLRTALQNLVQHCHTVIDIVAEMDPALVLSLPTFSFAPTVLYALFVLVNAFVAATDPSSTYGQCIAKATFGIEQCGIKLRSLTADLKALDPTSSCYTTHLFEATEWLEGWYIDYTAILQRYEMRRDH